MPVEGLHVDRNRPSDICRRFGVSRLEAFGSLVGAEAGPASDLDIPAYAERAREFLGSRSEAMRREKQLKSRSGRRFIRSVLEGAAGRPIGRRRP